MKKDYTLLTLRAASRSTILRRPAINCRPLLLLRSFEPRGIRGSSRSGASVQKGIQDPAGHFQRPVRTRLANLEPLCRAHIYPGFPTTAHLSHLQNIAQRFLHKRVHHAVQPRTKQARVSSFLGLSEAFRTFLPLDKAVFQEETYHSRMAQNLIFLSNRPDKEADK